MSKILIIEDEEAIADLERDYLESNIVQDRGYIGSSSASVFVAVGNGHAFEELVICRYR